MYRGIADFDAITTLLLPVPSTTVAFCKVHDFLAGIKFWKDEKENIFSHISELVQSLPYQMSGCPYRANTSCIITTCNVVDMSRKLTVAQHFIASCLWAESATGEIGRGFLIRTFLVDTYSDALFHVPYSLPANIY